MSDVSWRVLDLILKGLPFVFALVVFARLRSTWPKDKPGGAAAWTMRLRSLRRTAGELGIAALAGLAALVATAVAGLSTNFDTELVSFPVYVIGGWLLLYSPLWAALVFAVTLAALRRRA